MCCVFVCVRQQRLDLQIEQVRKQAVRNQSQRRKCSPETFCLLVDFVVNWVLLSFSPASPFVQLYL